MAPPARGGILVWWDCLEGAPVEIGRDGERWAIEHRPPGRGKKTHVHLARAKDARAAFRALSAGEDRVGLWPEKAGPKNATQGRDVSPDAPAPPPPPVGTQAVRRDMAAADRENLQEAMDRRVSADDVVTGLLGLTEATKPIYATTKDGMKIVGHEPDNAVRAQGWKLFLAYKEGAPVARKEEVKRHESSDADVFAKLATKPGYRRAFADYIARVERQVMERARNARGQVIEAESEDVDEGEGGDEAGG